MSISEAYTAFTEAYLVMGGYSAKTIKNYNGVITSFLKCCDDVDVIHITPETITRWKMSMEARGMSPATMRNYLIRLRKVLQFVKKRGLNVIDFDLIDLPKLPPTQPTYLESDEISQMLSVITSVRDRAIVACLFSTGCRISELLNLNRDDIHDNKATVVGKGGKLGTVYFDDRARAYLNLYLSQRGDRLKPLFISSQNRRITVSRVQQLLHEYADLANIDKNVTPHVFRHSYASDLKKNGADIFDIQQLLRHRKISSTMIYTHINSDYTDKVYQKYHSKA